MPFPPNVKEDALVACGRCCCICHKFCGTKIEVHHIREESEGGDNTFNNAIPLCFDCHADMRSYDHKHPKGNKYSESELRRHRDNWYDKIKGNIGVANRQTVVETDKQVYEFLVKVLPWDGSINFIRTNNFAGFSFELARLDDLYEFKHHCKNPAFEFIDPDLAGNFAAAPISDFPGMQATALLPKWSNIAEACMRFKALGREADRPVVWQHSSRVVLGMNEFIDGLIGYRLLAWSRAQGRDANSNVLGNTCGSKVHEFADLTNGEDGALYLFFRVANPKLRNGLAHGDAWADYDAGLVRHTEGRQDRCEHAIDIIEFMALVKFGCDLAKAYIGAVAAILLLEAGEYGAVSTATEHLIELWRD